MKYLLMMVLAASASYAADAENGKKIWQSAHIAADGQKRSCTSCHTDDPRQVGKHMRTGKRIEPMAPSVNPDRFQNPKKIEKWFYRNCKWTWGRVCSPQEKADILAYLKQQ